MEPITSDEGSDSAERKKALNSGKIRTTYSSVHKFMWAHEVVYTATCKPAEYEGISIPLFFSGDLAVISTEKPSIHYLMVQHLQDLMSNAELYGWKPVRAFLAIWLQQLEQDRETWANMEVKLKYRRPWCGIMLLDPCGQPQPPTSTPQQPKKLIRDR